MSDEQLKWGGKLLDVHHQASLLWDEWKAATTGEPTPTGRSPRGDHLERLQTRLEADPVGDEFEAARLAYLIQSVGLGSDDDPNLDWFADTDFGGIVARSDRLWAADEFARQTVDGKFDSAYIEVLAETDPNEMLTVQSLRRLKEEVRKERQTETPEGSKLFGGAFHVEMPSDETLIHITRSEPSNIQIVQNADNGLGWEYVDGWRIPVRWEPIQEVFTPPAPGYDAEAPPWIPKGIDHAEMWATDEALLTGYVVFVMNDGRAVTVSELMSSVDTLKEQFEYGLCERCIAHDDMADEETPKAVSRMSWDNLNAPADTTDGPSDWGYGTLVCEPCIGYVQEDPALTITDGPTPHELEYTPDPPQLGYGPVHTVGTVDTPDGPITVNIQLMETL